MRLVEAHSTTARCGRTVSRLELQVPFAMNGCERCTSRAMKAGTDYVVDIDHERVDLRTWRPFADR